MRYSADDNPIMLSQLFCLIVYLYMTGMIAITFGSLGMLILLFLQNGLRWLPYLGNMFFLIWASGLFYVMSKYSSCALTPYHAVKNIIYAMTDCLLLLDLQGHIQFSKPILKPGTAGLFRCSCHAP